MTEDRDTGRPTSPDADATRRMLESELGQVASAIAMVATGAATRVTVAGLRFGDQVVAASRELASRQGVVLEALWHAEDTGADVTVRRPA
jgi:hypothetical protein